MPAVSAGLLLYRRGARAGTTAGAPGRGVSGTSRLSRQAAGAGSVDAQIALPLPASSGGLEVLLVHPGGPYWARRHKGAWSIPKGEAEPAELGSAVASEAGAPATGGEHPPWRRAPARKLRLTAGDTDLLAVAVREFREETGMDPAALASPGDLTFVPLGGVKQKGHKIVYAWALEGDCDPSSLRSGEFEMEWPPHSGRQARFPEVDRAAWFDLEGARVALVPAQRRFLDDLAALVATAPTR